jgi:hypothetical protein
MDLASPLENAGRRRHARIAVRCPLALTLPNGAERNCTTLDMSIEGLSLATDLPISPGSRCRVHIPTLPCRSGPRPLRIEARAVYSSYLGPGSFRIGMVFVNPDEESAGVLADFAA